MRVAGRGYEPLRLSALSGTGRPKKDQAGYLKNPS